MNSDSIGARPRGRSLPSLLGLLGALLSASACQKETPKEVPAAAKPPAATLSPAAGAAGSPSTTPAATAAATPPKPAAKPLEWDDPSEWKRIPPSSPMRKASYEIPAAKGDPKAGELNVFVLGGDVDANIQRWVDEFSGVDPKTIARSERTVNGMREALVELPKGKFSGGMSDLHPSDNYGLLGAIVVTPSGAEYFFKLVGPAATVKAARAPFYKLLDSIRLQGGTVDPKPPAVAAPASTGSAAKPAAPAHAKKK
jgi:hypothetical protein